MRAGMIISSSIAFAIILPVSLAQAQTRTPVHIWIKAFIPNKISNPADAIVKTQKGTSVIEAPFKIGGMNVGPLSGTCFSTDDRSFSADQDASARISINFNIIFNGRREIEIQKIADRDIVTVGTTHNVDCKTGEDLRPPKTEDVSSVDIGQVKKNGFLRIFNVKGSSGNPFYRIPGINVGYAPKIDIEVVFEYNPITLTLDLHGVIGTFPAFEAYYAANSGDTKKIINLDPVPGATPASLLDLGTGINTRNFSDKIDLRPYLLPE